MKAAIEKQVSGMLQQDFGLQASEADEQSFQALKSLLRERIEFLLDHDFEKLLSLLYRIDVDETKAKSALVEKSDSKPAEVIAELILQRLIQKAKSRMSGRKANPSDQGTL